MRLAMKAHIGDGRQPHVGGRIDRAEVEEVQTVEEVLLNIPDTVFHSPLLISLGEVARRDAILFV